jgi:hypothetical protein
MNARTNRRYQALGRIQNFCRQHVGDFAPNGVFVTCLGALDQIVRDFGAALALQFGSDHTVKQARIAALRLDLKDVTCTARAIAQDIPGFADKFRLPKSGSLAALLTAAGVIIDELKKPGVAARFIAHELPEDFVQRLEEDRDAIEAEQDSEELDRGGKVRGTAELNRLLRAARKEVVTLNAIVRNKYKRNPSVLHEWQSISRVERAPRRESQPEPTLAVATVSLNAAAMESSNTAVPVNPPKAAQGTIVSNQAAFKRPHYQNGRGPEVAGGVRVPRERYGPFFMAENRPIGHFQASEYA